MEITGEVYDKEFYFLFTYSTKNSEDMKFMMDILQDPDLYSAVKEYDNDHVMIMVRADSFAWFNEEL